MKLVFAPAKPEPTVFTCDRCGKFTSVASGGRIFNDTAYEDLCDTYFALCGRCRKPERKP